jgi:hypothetical protein
VRQADEAVRRPDGSLFDIEGSQVRFTPTSCTGPADPTKQISDPCPTDSSTRRMFSYGRPNGQRVHGRKPPRSVRFGAARYSDSTGARVLCNAGRQLRCGAVARGSPTRGCARFLPAPGVFTVILSCSNERSQPCSVSLPPW